MHKVYDGGGGWKLVTRFYADCFAHLFAIASVRFDIFPHLRTLLDAIACFDSNCFADLFSIVQVTSK